MVEQVFEQEIDWKMRRREGDVDRFYGYYNVDVLSNGKTFDMLSVNGYTSQVWHHSWHGTYIQTVTVSEPTPVPELQYTLLVLVLGLALTSVVAKRTARRRT